MTFSRDPQKTQDNKSTIRRDKSATFIKVASRYLRRISVRGEDMRGSHPDVMPISYYRLLNSRIVY
jgi:hypothetical protein